MGKAVAPKSLKLFLEINLNLNQIYKIKKKKIER